MKFGFIGAGNIASAMICGALDSGLKPDRVYVTDVLAEAREKLAWRFGVRAAGSLEELAGDCGMIFVAVKPKNVKDLLPELKDVLKNTGRRVIVSTVAGRDLSYYSKHLGAAQPVARIMPNLNAEVGAAVTALCANSKLEASEKANVSEFLNRFGTVLEIDENDFPVFSALAGSGPAFVYLFIDALARAGVKNGLKKSTALQIAAQAALGSAKNILSSGKHPWELIDSVCSPGGLTVEGMLCLQSEAVESAVIRAVDAMVAKDRGM